MTPRAYRRIAFALVTACMVGASLAWPEAQQGGASAVAIDADDIGGVVTGPNGPEAGVWVEPGFELMEMACHEGERSVELMLRSRSTEKTGKEKR